MRSGRCRSPEIESVRTTLDGSEGLNLPCGHIRMRRCEFGVVSHRCNYCSSEASVPWCHRSDLSTSLRSTTLPFRLRVGTESQQIMLILQFSVQLTVFRI